MREMVRFYRSVSEIVPTISGYTINGLQIGATYAVSFGKLTDASSTNIAITGGTILYQNRNSSGGTYGANFGIAIIKANATSITQITQMVWGSKIYRID